MARRRDFSAFRFFSILLRCTAEGFLSLIRTNDPIRVGLLTEEPLRLEGLACIFQDQPSMVLLGQAQ